MVGDFLRILNFDDSVTKQTRLLSQYKTEIIDFTDIGPRARFWLDVKTAGEIRRRLRGSDANSITFLGSGDFHQVSNVLIKEYAEELSVIDFDFHPDWDILPPRFGCGSWVSQALKNKNILKALLLAAGSGDLRAPALQTGNLGVLRKQRLEIYPYRQESSRVYFRRVPENGSINVRRGLFSDEITWHPLEKEELGEFTLKLIRRLPSRKVYISIDKDCLKKEFALTNWEEGYLRLDQLLTILKVMRDNLDIIGLDITGDYSAPGVSGGIKTVISRIDHPRMITAQSCPPDLICRVNEETNLKIVQGIFS